MTWNKAKKYLTFLSCVVIFTVLFCFFASFADISKVFFDGFLIESGYNLKEVKITGNIFITNNEVKEKIKNFLGENTFTLAIFSIRAEIKKIPWCRDVIVTKKLPDKLEILIYEYKPFAILNSINLITEEFYKIVEFNAKKHAVLDLLMINISDEHQAHHLLKILKNTLNQQILSELKALEYISNRRWNITLKSGLVIKLPQENQKQALLRFVKFYSSKNFKEGEQIVDLRIPDRIFFGYIK